MNALAKPASLGDLSPVQEVHPQTSKGDFPPSKSPFPEQCPGHDDRSQGGGVVPCPGLDAASGRQVEASGGQGSEWGEESDEALNKGTVALPAARSLISLTSCQQSRKTFDLEKTNLTEISSPRVS